MFDKTDILEPTYAIRTGLDGSRYAVFRDQFAREDYERMYPNKFQGCSISCFGQYENAYQLPE